MKNANTTVKFKLTKKIVTRFTKGAHGSATAPTSVATVSQLLTTM
ncbi:hypothetical protein SAMN04487998_3421 [Hymenobacter actinosclerus]|uniref:Uncharacterized protein n=1 Tax=Hymenobacter actinosclerus TaxID=82805 RepID=A0A1I0IR98_9BACT|nr:hypothetical protein SAMN04487998_1319 [Hymenobacter actinosclerus]SET98920.1 hypothetical protein SAMN04487998_3421 [Hymenobacter actinosclerus]